MTLGGLFSGIGGFELAAIWAGIQPIWSNEIDPRCCKILKKRFTHEIIEQDIRGIGSKNLQPVDIICGGDPCQPHSFAGLGRGTSDDRYLWPEKFRIVQELQPPIVVNENVYGSISNGVLDIKADDLESIGYEVQSYCIPAEAVGALHQRERVWLIGYNSDFHRNRKKSRKLSKAKNGKQALEQKQHNLYKSWESVNLWSFNPDTDAKRFKEQYDSTKPTTQSKEFSIYFGFGAYPHGNIPRDFIESSIVGVLNGLPKGMDYADRNKRLAETGNAIVPQVAVEIFRFVKELYG